MRPVGKLGGGVWLAGCFVLAGGCAAVGAGAPRTDVVTKAEQTALTPRDVLVDLKAGNERFAAGRSTQQDWLAQAEQTARDGQHPKAIVLSCLDSRVPVEIVFDQGIGDVFVGRVAGNFENTDLLGSKEFGVAAAGAKLIVVLGHTSCGAVKGAIDNAELGNLTATLENIRPAVAAAGEMAEMTSANDAWVARVTEANVRQTVADITARSEVLRGLVERGDLMVVGGVYDIATGEIDWLEG
jgi:carbonic anhydrase